MKRLDKLLDFVKTLYKQFGVTKFTVAFASTVIGACVGFVVPTVLMPNDPIEDTEEIIEKENDIYE